MVMGTCFACVCVTRTIGYRGGIYITTRPGSSRFEVPVNTEYAKIFKKSQVAVQITLPIHSRSLILIASVRRNVNQGENKIKFGNIFV